MRIEIDRDSTLAKAGIIILLFVSFFIGIQERHSFVRLVYLIMQVVAIICILISGRIISRSQPILPKLALLCIMIIICNRNARLSHGSYSMDFHTCIAFLCYFLLYRKNNWYKAFLKCLITLGLFYSVTTIYLYLFPAAYSRFVYPLFGQESTITGTVQRGYAVGFSRHFSTTAIYHTVTLGIPISVLVKREVFENRQKYFMFLLLTLLYIGILLTGKRAHSIFIPFAVIICYCLCGSGKRINTLAKVIGGVFAFIVIIYVCIQIIPSLSNVIVRFQNKIEHGDITSGRSVMIEECRTLFLSNIFFGGGWGSFSYYTATGVKNAHNVFVQLLAENGMILSVPFYIFVFGNIWQTGKAILVIIKEKKKLSKSFMICLIYSSYIQLFFIMYCFTGNPLYDFQCMLPYILGCAIGENAYRIYVVSNRAIARNTTWKTIRRECEDIV